MRKMFCICMFIGVIQSCNTHTMDIDTIIQKYDTTDFSALKNKSIYFRSRSDFPNSSIYFVSDYNSNCSPYAVEVNNNNGSIIEISDSLVLLSCGSNYLSKEEIVVLVKKYLEYRLRLLQVDDEGNVYINPDKEELPIFLRKAPNAIPKDISKFHLYKRNWYIRK